MLKLGAAIQQMNKHDCERQGKGTADEFFEGAHSMHGKSIRFFDYIFECTRLFGVIVLIE